MALSQPKKIATKKSNASPLLRLTREKIWEPLYTRDVLRLKKMGLTPRALQERGYGIDYLVAAGYSPQEMMKLGYSWKELLQNNHLFPVPQVPIKIARFSHPSVAALRNRGFTTAQILGANFSTQKLMEGGYSARELRREGYSAQRMRKFGYSRADLIRIGYSEKEARETTTKKPVARRR